MENLGFEIRKQVTRYLAGDISMSGLNTALAPLTWDIERRTDPRAASLGREIELLLAECSHGSWSEAETKNQLRSLLDSPSSFEAGETIVLITSASSTSSSVQISWGPSLGLSVDRESVTASS